MPYSTESRRLNTLELSLIRQVLQNAPSDAINLALGELGFPLPRILREKAIELLQNNTPVYTPNAGISELRSAIANQYPNANPDCVCVCNGAEEAVFVTLLSLVNSGDKVAIPDPDYPAYSAISNILEAEVIRLPFESDLLSVDWNKWEQLLAQDVRVLIFSHPSNPCGHVFSPEEIDILLGICSRCQITIIVDDIYARLNFNQAPPQFYGRYQALFVVGGVSKSHCMSGWRIGWVLAPAKMISSIVKARQYISTCSNWLSQHLAAYALSEEGMQSVNAVMAQLTECRKLVIEAFHPYADKVILPKATPYFMLQVDEDDLQVSRNLAHKGVVCVPGSAFGSVSKGWLRINYAVSQDKLSRALGSICHELYLY